ncbi:MAG TPA: VWA domain-containing protein [Blastocatellia bacterium]|nr:VWA domain-containing protein [Blastocatellia bacterium]
MNNQNSPAIRAKAPLKKRSAQRRRLWCVASVVMLFTQAALAARPPQSAANKVESQDQPIRLKTDLIELRAVVTDKQGKPITDLTKDDFEITEDGRKQVVSFFTAEQISGALATSPPGASPASRRQVPPAARPKRTVALFVDTLHMTTASMMQVKQHMLKFVDERLGDEDLAAVVATGGGLGLFSQFTSDKRVLRAAINRLSNFPASRSDSAYTPFLAAKVEAEDANAIEVAKSIVRQEEHLPDDPHFESLVTNLAKSRARQISVEATYLRRETLSVLKAVAARIAEMPGQRMVLMLSDGFTQLDESGVTDSDDLRAAISRATRSGVVVYAVNAKGLHGNRMYDVTTSVPSEPHLAHLLPGYFAAGDREVEAGLERLAKGTGGEAFLTTNDLKGALGKALDDNGFYYVLAYYPTAPKDKKSFRSINVRVKGHPDYRVRTQSGYLTSDLLKEKTALPTDPRESLIKTMGEPLAATEIGVDASADFLWLSSDDAQVSVYVFVAARNLGYKEQGQSFVTSFTLLTGVLDSSGRTTNVLQDAVQIRLSREQLDRAREDVYRYTKRLRLERGLYQIRVGVFDSQTGKMGTASTWVEVPDLKSRKLILSSISTARLPSDDKATEAAKQAVSQPRVRNGLLLFRRDDVLAYYGKARQAGLGERSAAGLMIQEQILKDEEVVFEDTWKPLSSLVLAKEADSVEFGGRVPSSRLTPGYYTLRISVKDPQSKAAQTRETSFEVVP